MFRLQDSNTTSHYEAYPKVYQSSAQKVWDKKVSLARAIKGIINSEILYIKCFLQYSHRAEVAD